MEFITAYIDQYGYIVLFLALMLELLALPFPGEVLMGYAGFLVYQGHLNWVVSIIMAGIGSSVGMTLSYWIGFKLGTPFFEKHGHRFHLGPDRLDKTSKWFTTYGNKVIVIAYYIPGVRHITGYFAGITRLPFRIYALYAYGGAFIWVTVFISLGKILGPQWEQFHATVKKYLLIGSIIAAFVLVIIYVFKRNKVQIKDAALIGVNRILNLFHTRRRAGMFIVGVTVASLGFIILMISMTQDFLGNEFNDFNEIVSLLVPLIFKEHWERTMEVILSLGSQKILVTVSIMTLFLLLWRGRDRVLEIMFLMIIVIGGELYEEGLRRVFHQIGPVKYTIIERLPYSFPSEQSLMSFVIYGFFVFMLVRHTRSAWIHTVGAVCTLFILLLIAISRVYFDIQVPSDVAAGYVFGGVWLSINILLLEILRLMRVVERK